MSEMRICDVHKLIDNDLSLRQCVWCAMCQAWICTEDIRRWDRRSRAVAKNWGRKAATPQVTTGCGGCKKSGLDK